MSNTNYKIEMCVGKHFCWPAWGATTRVQQPPGVPLRGIGVCYVTIASRTFPYSFWWEIFENLHHAQIWTVIEGVSHHIFLSVVGNVTRAGGPDTHRVGRTSFEEHLN